VASVRPLLALAKGLQQLAALVFRQPVRSRIHQLLAIICALHVSGVHWLALQTVAWTGMLVTRTQMASITEAVSSTFDGDHPCPLCRAVEEAQRQQSKDEPVPLLEQLGKVNFVGPLATALPAPTVHGFQFPALIQVGELRSESPPTPPPLSA
jgi:hypothetical protein